MNTKLTNAPRVRLLPKHHRRVKIGHPWIYSNEVALTDAAKALPAGALVTFENAAGEAVGTGVFNSKPLVVGRILSRKPGEAIDVAFFERCIAKAMRLRDRLFPEPFYRLIHAEADGLPGLIIDRYGDVLVMQINTAGMELFKDMLVAALQSCLAPRAILIRKDTHARSVEGLSLEEDEIIGSLDGQIEVMENSLVFFADPAGGQKTGWFYDQRANRAAVTAVANGGRVLDVYCYLGGFGMNAAAAGAAHVTFVDRSEPALELAEAAAERNNLADRCNFVRSEAFDYLDKAVQNGERWDVVIVDPPAFVKSRKDLSAGLRGYRKLIKLAARLVAKEGFLFAASCSHNVDDAAFKEQVRHGLTDANRNGRLLRAAGAGPDHPVHPFLAESAYLSSEFLQLD
jgi:23S rRNA (cytosine1962-C5)-methyltransferase